MQKGKINYDHDQQRDTRNYHQIENVDKYKYLRQTLKMDTNTEAEILTRIQAGWRSFGIHKAL